jgi:ribosomal protein S18 acetylase RimI-like enzyme
MMNSDSYEVFPIPLPPTDPHIHHYTTLRLTSLQTNPECFSSTYARESAFTNTQWQERLNSTGRGTIIASTLEQNDGSGTPVTGSKWAGMASILSPDFLRNISLELPDAVSHWHKRGSAYILVGMWVHPEHRRQGLGKKLVDGGFDWVRRNGVLEDTVDGTGNYKKVLLLEVYRSNEHAIALYGRMGFKEVPSSSPEGPTMDVDTIWMAAHVESLS